VSREADAAAARARLRARFAQTPAAVRRALEAPLPSLAFDPRTLRRIRVTGIGASESHARALAWLLAERLGLDARFTPAGALSTGALPGSEADGLVVFSQGLSPNARYALAAPERWRAAMLVTAATPQGAGEAQRAWLEALARAGVGRLRFEPENEYDGLVRVQGPLCGLAAALQLARAVAHALGRDGAIESAPPAQVEGRIAGAEPAVNAARDALPADALERRPIFVATGGYAELVHNLRLKLLEGLLIPMPPAWDLIELAHGPLQQAFDDPLCLIALLRADAGDESVWLERLHAVLEPSRHAVLSLRATLPGVYALFEHDAMLTALLLSRQDALGRDPARWPGQGRESALYLASPQPPATGAARTTESDPAATRELAAMVWTQLPARPDPDATAVVPLGAVEQHGPHLPFATDAWIADALAARFCARVPGAIRLPALALGVSPEHADFPGTLALRAETFTEVLADVVASLARHGFGRVFLFSAHGGNAEPLRAALPRLREVARAHGGPGPRVIAHTDLAGLTRRLLAAAAAEGVDAGAAGHHAGEIETSILLALRPGSVRREAFAAGTLSACPDAQPIFYPSLRANAPSGTVGDPRPADAERGARYLEAWTEALVACFREDTPA
jgi:creatinine amidohydrolase